MDNDQLPGRRDTERSDPPRTVGEMAAVPWQHRSRRNGSNRFRHLLYELIIGPVTHLCYGAALNYFRDNSTVLDVGIGNGYMIPRYHELIKSKGLDITGIDISTAALTECAGRVRAYGLEDRIELHRESIENFRSQRDRRFDYVFFSMTFMLMKKPSAVLDRVRQMISRKGQIAFFQTMYPEKMATLDFIKPKLKYVTGIDFGPASYDEDFFKLLKNHRMTVTEDRLLQKTFFRGEFRFIAALPDSETAKDAQRWKISM